MSTTPLLIGFSLVPLLGGWVRLASLATATADERFARAPLPVVLHIAFAALFCVAGAFQFQDGFGAARWHRRLGWAMTVAGLVTALTGVWMTLTYAIPEALQGRLLFAARLAAGGGMAACLVWALESIRRGRVAAHRLWMMRAYALGQGAGTQAVLFLAAVPFAGVITGVPRDLLMTLAWLVNLLVVERLRAPQLPGGLTSRQTIGFKSSRA